MSSPARSRDAAATRAALLDAARALFARDGYDATTVRGIADRAGVNQALLFRYFGNKDGLFAAAVREPALRLLEAPADALLDRILDAVLSDSAPDPFLSVLRGSTAGPVGSALRAEIGGAYAAALAGLIADTDRAEAAARAELLLAWLLGISVARSLPDGLPSVGPDAVTHLRRAADALLFGPT